MKFQALPIAAAFVILFGGFAVGSDCEKQEKIPLSNETRTFNLTKNANDICLEVSPPGGDEFIAALIKSDGLSLQIDGDHELAPPTPDNQQCIILTFNKRCKVWQDKLKYICEAEATVIVIHGPTTVRLGSNSNSTEDRVNSTASVSYPPVGKFAGVLCNGTKDGGDKQDDHLLYGLIVVVEILLIVGLLIAVVSALIFISLWLFQYVQYRRRKSGEHSTVDERNPKDVENGGDSGHVLLNGNESASV